MGITAVLPVRNSSTRCVNKNFKQFADSSLFEIKLKQLLRMNNIDDIIVISDNINAISIAKRNNCSFYLEEPVPPENITPNELFHLIATVVSSENIALVHCTNPLLKDETLQSAINLFLELDKKYDSVNSAEELKKFVFYKGKPVNYDPLNHPRTQDLKDTFIRVPAFSILSRETMFDRRANVGMNPFLFPISSKEAIDIDNDLDFEIAEFLYKKLHD